MDELSRRRSKSNSKSEVLHLSTTWPYYLINENIFSGPSNNALEILTMHSSNYGIRSQ